VYLEKFIIRWYSILCVLIYSRLSAALAYFDNAEWRRYMRLSYDKLWKLMKNNKLRKGELATAAEVSEYTMSKLAHDEPVSLDVIMKFCKIFHCDIGDVVEIIEED